MNCSSGIVIFLVSLVAFLHISRHDFCSSIHIYLKVPLNIWMFGLSSARICFIFIRLFIILWFGLIYCEIILPFVLTRGCIHLLFGLIGIHLILSPLVSSFWSSSSSCFLLSFFATFFIFYLFCWEFHTTKITIPRYPFNYMVNFCCFL